MCYYGCVQRYFREHHKRTIYTVIIIDLLNFNKKDLEANKQRPAFKERGKSDCVPFEKAL